MKRAGGFTLVEVMVALAVVAIALPALMVTLYQQVDNTGYLRDKSLAHAVAANKLTEIRILSRARESLLSGKDSGTATVADRDWFWWVQSETTDVEQFYRVTISVAAEEEQQDQPLLTLVAYMSADLRSETEPDPADDGDLGVGSGSPTPGQPAQPEPRRAAPGSPQISPDR